MDLEATKVAILLEGHSELVCVLRPRGRGCDGGVRGSVETKGGREARGMSIGA